MGRAQRSPPRYLAARLVLLAACLVLPAACGEPKPPRARDFLDLLEDYRRSAGVAAPARDEALTRAAEAHAAEMERLGYFGHYSPTPGNRTPDDRVQREGWPPDRRYSELLALADSADGALAAWKAKPELDRALVDAGYGVIGFARRGRHWVLLLGATTGKHEGVTDR